MGQSRRRRRSGEAFWWDFIVGDDWRICAAVVGALAASAGLHAAVAAVWRVVPLTVVAVLAVSLRRAMV